MSSGIQTGERRSAASLETDRASRKRRTCWEIIAGATMAFAMIMNEFVASTSPRSRDCSATEASRSFHRHEFDFEELRPELTRDKDAVGVRVVRDAIEDVDRVGGAVFL